MMTSVPWYGWTSVSEIINRPRDKNLWTWWPHELEENAQKPKFFSAVIEKWSMIHSCKLPQERFMFYNCLPFACWCCVSGSSVVQPLHCHLQSPSDWIVNIVVNYGVKVFKGCGIFNFFIVECILVSLWCIPCYGVSNDTEACMSVVIV